MFCLIKFMVKKEINNYNKTVIENGNECIQRKKETDDFKVCDDRKDKIVHVREVMT